MPEQLTCILCPNGCDLIIEAEGKKLCSIEGNLCKRGIDYATQELTHPVRNIATSVLVTNGTLPLCSVRLTNPIPKEKIFDVMQEIKKRSLEAPVSIGQVIIPNVLGLQSDVIATKPIPKPKSPLA